MLINGIVKIDNTYADYVSFGRGNKNLIIINGIGDGFKTVKGMALSFSIMYKKFIKDYKVYIFSRRNDLPSNFTTKDMANDIIRHMKDLNIESSDILGVSQGGMIAQFIAINNPEKVNKLILSVTVPRPNEIITNTINNWLKMAKNNDYKGIIIDLVEKSYTDSYLDKNMKKYKILSELSKISSLERFKVEANACINHNSYDKLNKIKSKTLIIGAKNDKVLGISGSLELHKKIKNSELYIYEKYSHGLHDQAKDYYDRIFEFLKK